MKFLIGCFCFILVSANSKAQGQNVNSGLVAWYKFDGDTKDASTYANHGNAHNVTFASGKCGQANSALYLNGKDAYVSLPLASSLNGKKQLTITAWVKPVRFNNIRQTLKTVYSHWLGMGVMGPIGVLFGVGADSSVVSAFSGGYQISSPTVVRSSDWQLVTLLYDGTKSVDADRAIFQVNCKEYKPNCNNGYSTCSATPSSLGSLATYTYIGARQGNTGQLIDYFEGYIDDMRLYDRVLTKDELSQLFLECGPPPCDDNNCLTDDQINPNTCQCEHITKAKPTCNDNNCLTEDRFNENTCQCEYIVKAKPACDDNNCLTDDRFNENTCQCEYITKSLPDCNDNNSQTEDTYNTSTCTCEHIVKSTIAKPGVYMPFAFTPNKDGVNDKYKPVYQRVASVILTIYNRWGEVIFQGNSLTDEWDGTYKTVPCLQGVYPYKLKGEYDDGEKFESSGSILLIQ